MAAIIAHPPGSEHDDPGMDVVAAEGELSAAAAGVWLAGVWLVCPVAGECIARIMPASGTVADAVMLWEPVMMCIPRIPAMMASIPASRTVRRRKAATRPDRNAVMVFLLSYGSCSFKGTGPDVCRIQQTLRGSVSAAAAARAFRATMIVDISAAPAAGEITNPPKRRCRAGSWPDRHRNGWTTWC
jgi:hypothetical protein